MTDLSKLIFNKKYKFKSQGGSMLPLLCDGDLIYYKKIKFDQVRINDLILVSINKKRFTLEHGGFTHRVIYKSNNYLITKGDNTYISDGKIFPSQIVAKAIEVKRNGKLFNPESIYLVQSTLYFQEIVKIKNEFENNSIDFVFLKGLPVHLYYEKVHPKRVYADCDVLIRKNDFIKAERIIIKFGYRKTDKKNENIENNYYKIINGIYVIFDIHLEPAFLMTQLSTLEALYPIKLTNIFNEKLLLNKRKVVIDGEMFKILNSNYLIIYLALHLFHHNFKNAFRYQFLDNVIRKSHLTKKDWREIAQTINNNLFANFTYTAFFLTKKYYQTPIPNLFFNSIRFDQVKLQEYGRKGLDIFNDEPRFNAGISRFKNIFLLSPYPVWRKIFVFTNPTVVYFVLLSLKRKLFSFFSGLLKGH